MAEQWRDIAGTDGVYQVSDLGHIRNTQTSKILQPVKFKNGRLYVTLSSGGFQRKCTVHGLVAAAFLGCLPAGSAEDSPRERRMHRQLGRRSEIKPARNQKRFVLRTSRSSVNLTKRVQTSGWHALSTCRHFSQWSRQARRGFGPWR